jgi:hypothetical protein
MLDERTVLFPMAPGTWGRASSGRCSGRARLSSCRAGPRSDLRPFERTHRVHDRQPTDRGGGPHEPFEGAEELADTAHKQVGAVTDVVSLIGGWWAGKSLRKVSEVDWQHVFVSPATTGLALVRAFVPRLAGIGSYITIAGFSAQAPTVGSGPGQHAGRRTVGDGRVLSEEVRGAPHQRRHAWPDHQPVAAAGPGRLAHSDQVGDVVARIVADPAVRDTLVDVQDKAAYETFLGL